ncbi:hypothetical protein ACIQNU_04055 [Streptomyces sp. NPDC091292]|uniref:hypothetical protein n=1 Tax=Streptomyces sp. NPDC091292 TaxID=3365991 RepID=UPI003830C2E3
MTGDWEPEADDVKAMRRENGGQDFRAFMRQQIATGNARRGGTPKPVDLKPPGHKPGAWPTGTSPPGPPPERSIPKPIWDAAIRHYRNEEHRPDQPCDCGNCPPEET